MGADRLERHDTWDKSHVAIAWQTPGWTHPDSIPLSVCQAMLGTYNEFAHLPPPPGSPPSTVTAPGSEHKVTFMYRVTPKVMGPLTNLLSVFSPSPYLMVFPQIC